MEALLEEENITTAQLMPKEQPAGIVSGVKLNTDPSNPAPFPSYLPLEVFDDEEYDSRTVHEWLHMGEEDGIRKPVPGRALLPTRDDSHHR